MVDRLVLDSRQIHDIGPRVLIRGGAEAFQRVVVDFMRAEGREQWSRVPEEGDDIAKKRFYRRVVWPLVGLVRERGRGGGGMVL